MTTGDESRVPSPDPDADWRVVERRHYDPDSGPDLTTVVVEAVTAAEGTDAKDIGDPPLYDVVDVVAIRDALFGTKQMDARGVTGGSLVFEYRGYRVTVRSDGWVRLAEPADS